VREGPGTGRPAHHPVAIRRIGLQPMLSQRASSENSKRPPRKLSRSPMRESAAIRLRAVSLQTRPGKLAVTPTWA
jgi:hypothetical protein